MSLHCRPMSRPFARSRSSIARGQSSRRCGRVRMNHFAGCIPACPCTGIRRIPGPRPCRLIFLANNPNPESSRHVLVNAPGAGKYSEVHARFHPTLNRYQSAFGFYDTLLIGARDNRILYTVAKEIDLAVSLRDPPYNTASLARLAERALELQKPETHVVEDYEPYLPSKSAPAAFFGARCGGMV